MYTNSRDRWQFNGGRDDFEDSDDDRLEDSYSDEERMEEEIYNLKGTLTKKCVVLDLDETLVHTYLDDEDDKSATDFVKLKIPGRADCLDLRQRCFNIDLMDYGGKRGEGSKKIYWAVKRPYLDDFLKTCFNYFNIVVVWSAGEKEYVHKICEKIFADFFAPDMILTRENCDNSNGNHEKPLKKLYNELPEMNPKNTLIIDDRRTTSEANPDNLVLVPPFEPKPQIESLRTEDDRLKQIMQWLLKPETINSNDVRRLSKQIIFQ